jgi:hypothetical protein
MQAYAEYANAVKNLSDLSARVSAARGFPRHADPLPPDADTMKALAHAEAERGRKWEAVLLLGDPETVYAAREWHQAIWRLLYYARGWLTDADQFMPAKIEADCARDKFYDCARRDLALIIHADRSLASTGRQAV